MRPDIFGLTLFCGGFASNSNKKHPLVTVDSRTCGFACVGFFVVSWSVFFFRPPICLVFMLACVRAHFLSTFLTSPTTTTSSTPSSWRLSDAGDAVEFLPFLLQRNPLRVSAGLLFDMHVNMVHANAVTDRVRLCVRAFVCPNRYPDCVSNPHADNGLTLSRHAAHFELRFN